MKKVLEVASVISFFEWFNKENIDHLKKDLGCEVHVAVNLDYMNDTDKARTLAYIDKLKADGIILHNIKFARSPFGKDNFAAYRELKRIIDENKFDLIHCHTPVASILTRLAARKSRKRGSIVMYTCHGFHFHNKSPKINWMVFYPIEKLLSSQCDYLVTINHEDYNRAKTFYTPKVRYIPGVGVDIRHISETVIDKSAYRRILGIPENAFVIISMGEMIPRKNHEVIIRALGELKDKDIYYLICGKGPLKETLQDLAKELGVGLNVKFLGFRKDIAELIHASDISAFPSRIEGLGLAGIEAMAAGIPLVSSNVHGILDYVKDGETGFAIDPDNVSGFAVAINFLKSNPDRRMEMGKKCLEAVKPFQLENALQCMWNIFDEALNDSENEHRL